MGALIGRGRMGFDPSGTFGRFWPSFRFSRGGLTIRGMPYRSLADFLEELENDGELVRVAAEVDPEMELAEIVAQFQSRTTSATGGAGPAADSPALLFQNVKGCRPAVAVNLLASESRIRRALGIDSLAEMAQRLSDALTGQSAAPWFERLKWGRGEAGDRWQPKFVRTGACQQVVRLAGDVDLTTLPALKNWPDEVGRSIAAAQLYSVDPENGERSIEACEAEVLDRARLALVLEPRGAAMRRLEICRARGERLPIALVLGGDPVCRLITASPLAAALDSFVCGGLFRNQPIELVKCRSHDLGVPADADLVIEAYLDPTAPTVTAGPIGAGTGFYSLPRSAPVAQVMAITERTSPICPAFVGNGARPIGGQLGGGHPAGQLAGRLDSEQAAMARALVRICLPLVQAVVPELVDFALPAWGGPRKFAFVSIRKSYPFQARKVASALWGWEPLAGVKMLVVVDADVNVHDANEVWSRVGANVHPGRDVFNHVRLDRRGRTRDPCCQAELIRWHSTPRPSCPKSMRAPGQPQPSPAMRSARWSPVAGPNMGCLPLPLLGGYDAVFACG